MVINTRIDVTNNPLLQRLDLSYNNLSMTDFTENSSLIWLNVDGNSALTILNVKENIGLVELYASGLSISSIDLSNNNQLRTLDVSNNANISHLYLSNNLKLEKLDITGNNSIKNLQILLETCKVISNYSVVDNVNTFGRVCIFNTEAGETYFVAWNAESVLHDDAKSLSEARGMYLPNRSQSEEIASRIQNIREALDIVENYSEQDFWTGDRRYSSSGLIFYYYINFDNDGAYEVLDDRNDYDHRYFSIFIK